MTADTENAPEIEALTDLLEEERSALLRGDLDATAALLPEKERLLAALPEAAAPKAAPLQELAKRVACNQLLLEGALEGLRSVTERLAALRRVRDSLETYGADGKRRRHGTSPRRALERRA